MMLIYPNQHELDRTDNRTTMGLAPRTKPNIILKGPSHKCYEAKAESVEEMLREEGNKSPDVIFTLPPTLRVWKYDDFHFEQIGEGFFGNVYKVAHKTSGDILVLKELKSATDEEHKTMFIEEIKTMHRLCHPNVLKCEGMALHDDNLCLLTEYITGGSLDELLVERSTLLNSWEARLSIALEIGCGMHYLHSQGVIHRDLASKNILIRKREGDRLHAIVADLGLSHTVKGLALSEEEYDLETVGSPFHMAPEVLNHKPYNMKADVFSYGIILCEIITMSPGADPDDVPRNDDFGLAVEDFSEMASDCPSSLLDLTVRCCQFNPRERPSFDNIVKALDIMLDNFVNSDDELLSGDATPDYSLFLDHSLICTCKSVYENNFYEDDTQDVNDVELGVEMFRDRFGSVRKRASRRVLKSKLQRCVQCGGRVWKSIDNNIEYDAAREEENVDQSGEVLNDPYVTPPRETQALPILRPEYSAGVLLNESQDAAEFCKLVDNTPGKLPKFFRNLLRHKGGKKGIKDVKRRWRKSFHEMFSSHSSHGEGAQKYADTDNESTERIASPTLFIDERVILSNKDEHFENEKCEKHEKPRKLSKFRRKSEQKTQLSYQKSGDTYVNSNSLPTNMMSYKNYSQNSNGTKGESCGSTNGEDMTVLSPRQAEGKLGKKLAVSVDSLDKLAISEDTEKSQSSRRYSIPNRKSRQSRAQSVEAPRPTLQKKSSSSSSRILNFLRKRSLGSPREKDS